MPLDPIPGFCIGSDSSRARGANAQRTANMLSEKNGPGGNGEFTLVPRAGKELFTTGPTGAWYGAWANKSRVFCVSVAGELYELYQDGTFLDYTIAGGLAPAEPVIIRSNGNQIGLVSGGYFWIADGIDVYKPYISYARSYVTIAGTTVTWVSGDLFTDVISGDFVHFDDGVGQTTTRRVTGTPSPTSLQLTSTGPTLTPPATAFLASWGSPTVPGGSVAPYIPAKSLEMVDGYFVVGITDTKDFRISNSLNGKIWDVLDIAHKSGSTDNIAALADLGGQLVVIGDTNSTEIWANSGSVDFPFVRVSGRTMNMGTDARYSVAKLPDGSLCWLMCATAGREMVVRTTGSEPTRISNHALENAMRGYSVISDAVGSTFLENGHPIYRLDFPTANRTWFFDASNGLWTEIGPGTGTGTPEVWTADKARFNVHVTWPNGTRMRLGFDHSSGKIWKISPDYLDDEGTDFECMRISPHVAPNLDPMTCNAFALDCELGTVAAGVNGADGLPLIPKVSMQYSDDGARTWSTAQDASLGRNTEYQGTFLTAAELAAGGGSSQTNPQGFETMPIWRALGRFYIAKTFKIKANAKYLRAIYNGLVDVSK